MVNRFVYRSTIHVVRFVLSIFCNISVSGVSHIPLSGRVIIAANHLHSIDGFLIAAFIPRRLHFITRAEVFSCFIFRWYLLRMGAIAVDRAKCQPKTYRNIDRFLQSDQCVALFPEGKVTREIRLGDFRRGVSFFSVKNDAPVIPIVIQGSSNLLSWRTLIRRPLISIKIGELLAASPVKNRRKAVQCVLREVRDAIDGLLSWGQNKTDTKTRQLKCLDIQDFQSLYACCQNLQLLPLPRVFVVGSVSPVIYPEKRPSKCGHRSDIMSGNCRMTSPSFLP